MGINVQNILGKPNVNKSIEDNTPMNTKMDIIGTKKVLNYVKEERDDGAYLVPIVDDSYLMPFVKSAKNIESASKFFALLEKRGVEMIQCALPHELCYKKDFELKDGRKMVGFFWKVGINGNFIEIRSTIEGVRLPRPFYDILTAQLETHQVNQKTLTSLDNSHLPDKALPTDKELQ